MRYRKRLKPEEAKFLGIRLKEKKDPTRNPAYDLSKSQWLKLKEKRNSGVEVDNKTVPNDYNPDEFVLSAYDYEKGKILSVEEYCDRYNMDYSKVTSYKFLPHHYKQPTYHIVFSEAKVDEDIPDFGKVKSLLEKELSKTYVYQESTHKLDCEYVLKWSDLHFGSHIRNLLRTPDYDSDILYKGLMKSVDKTNAMGFKKVHVHILGDLIESFSGLNHINSWMSMNKEEIGSNAVKMCSKLLDSVFSEMNNLGSIKIVAGNHDRTSKANDEDVKGGAADLIAYCLELMGYDVEFDPLVITHEVDEVVHINLHGDKGISKRSTEDIIWKYGVQGKFNLICEGHLHTMMEKLSVKQRESFKVLKDDGIDKRRMYCPSFFPGNFYSESLGYDTNTGYLGVCNTGCGRPDVYNMAI